MVRARHNLISLNSRDQCFYDGLERTRDEVSNLKDVVVVLKYNPLVVSPLPEFIKFVRLLLVVPFSAYTGGRSFSILRRD